MNCYMIRNVRAVTIVFGLFSGVLTMGWPKVLNWFEAQERCRGRGLTIETSRLSNKEYWTGRYIRLSPWIKILGCYSDSSILNHNERVDTIMDTKSVGACQEICKNENSTTFAVKSERCTCLKGLVNFDSMSEYSPSHCNYSCDSIDGIYSEECGGEAAHNVFISDQGDGLEEYKDKYCMSLQCSAQNPIYLAESCSVFLYKICKNSTGNAMKWKDSMERCKNSTFPSYLYGNLDLTNANESCHTLPKGKYELRWIGIARQKYKMIDQGRTIKDDEKKYFLFCQKCKNRDNCEFSTCTDETQNETFCSSRTTTTDKTISNKPFTITSISSHQSLITEEISTSTRSSNPTNEKQTTLKQTKTTLPNYQMTTFNERYTTSETQQISDETNATLELTTTTVDKKGQKMDDESDTVLSIAIILGIVFAAIAIMLPVIYIRRRNLNRKMGDNIKKPPKLDEVCSTNSEANNLHDNSYFVIEKPSSYEMADNSALDSESPYNETEDGDYDHLRNKDSKKKDVDDTYQHAPSVMNGDTSHYDSTTTNEGLGNTGRIINRSTNNESPELKGDNSTYSEVDNIPDSAYFVLEKPSPYELADNSVIDSESPYNEAEEGDYDHLRNEGSRKKDVEDTYQHATFDSNRDISDYDTSPNDQKQEFESTYDHMHESLNLNRNSDYGYNSIDPNVVKEPTYDKTVKSL